MKITPADEDRDEFYDLFEYVLSDGLSKNQKQQMKSLFTVQWQWIENKLNERYQTGYDDGYQRGYNEGLRDF